MRDLQTRLALLLPMLAGLAACGAPAPGGNETSSPAIDNETTTDDAPAPTASTKATEPPSDPLVGDPGVDVALNPHRLTTGLGEKQLCTGMVQAYHPLEGVTTAPERDVDFMELREEVIPFQQVFVPGAPPPEPQLTVIDRVGEICKTASQRTACEAAVAAVRSTVAWPAYSFGGTARRYIVATKGDGIQIIGTLDGLRDLIMPIDNAKDAALLVTATGHRRIDCDGTPQAIVSPGGFLVKTGTNSNCFPSPINKHAVTVPGDVTQIESVMPTSKFISCVALGRKPAGLAEAAIDEHASHVAAFFAECAHLEAASVVSFERLAAELRDLLAPEELAQKALASRDDEVKHTRMTTKMAERLGATVRPPTIADALDRTPFEIALENAVEGCVKETYAALLAHYQAQHAKDRSLAAMMEVIAEDETRHAALAWEVAEWLEPRLTDEERAEVQHARATAIEELRASLSIEPPAELVESVGMPPAQHALAMLDNLDTTFLRAA